MTDFRTAGSHIPPKRPDARPPVMQNEIVPTYFPLGPSGDELLKAAVALVVAGHDNDATTAAEGYLKAIFVASYPVERHMTADGRVMEKEKARRLGLLGE